MRPGPVYYGHFGSFRFSTLGSRLVAETARQLGVSTAGIAQAVPRAEPPGPAIHRELSEGKSAATNADFLDNQERCGDFLGWHQHKHSIQPIFDFPVAVIPTPKKDESGGFGMSGREKAGIVQVRRQNDPSFQVGTIKHLHIRGPQ
jgi:hypothetical protein